MKKNIFSVIITALTVINVVLTAVLFFVMLPTFNKTNNLLTKVASVLNIELDADSEANGDSNYKLSDLQAIPVTWDNEATYNLKAADGEKNARFAQLRGYSLYLNKNADDFDEVNEMLTADTAQITRLISSVVVKHTYAEATQDLIQKETLEEIEKLLDSKVVVRIALDGFVKQ